MEFSLNVTVTASPELLRILESFLPTGPARYAVQQKEDAPKTKKVKASEPQQASQPEPQEAAVEAPEQEQTNSNETVTLEMIRASVAVAASKGKREQVVELLKEFKASKVPDLLPSDYSTFYTQLQAL